MKIYNALIKMIMFEHNIKILDFAQGSIAPSAKLFLLFGQLNLDLHLNLHQYPHILHMLHMDY